MSLLLYILLPYILWLLTFVIFKEFFWILMPLSTGILGILTITLYRNVLRLGSLTKGVSTGIIGAIILYIIFLLGDLASKYFGFSNYVDSVYTLVGSAPNILILGIGMIWIGCMEELYWRGGLQGLLYKKGFDKAWLISSILYSLVHIVTYNPILILAALIVGLFLSKMVDLYGLYSTIFTHIIWLQLVIVLFPLR